jgi:hypothetical protein
VQKLHLSIFSVAGFVDMNNIKKLLMILIVVALITGIIAVPTFAAQSLKYEDEARVLNQLALFKGVSATEYRPNLEAKLLREEAVALLLRIFGLEEEALKMNEKEASNILKGFKDADEIATWAIRYIAYAVENNVIVGRPDSNFAPKDNLLGREYSKMILAMLGYVQGIDFQYEFSTYEFCNITGFSKSEAAKLDTQYILRDDAVGMSFFALTAEYAAGKNKGITVIEAIVGDDEDLKEIAINAGLIKEVVIISVESLDDIEVKVGEWLRLPSKVRAIYSDGKVADVSVNWPDVDTSKPKEKTKIIGVIEGTDIVAKVNVTIKADKPKVEDVVADNLEEINVGYSEDISDDIEVDEDIPVIPEIFIKTVKATATDTIELVFNQELASVSHHAFKIRTTGTNKSYTVIGMNTDLDDGNTKVILTVEGEERVNGRTIVVGLPHDLEGITLDFIGKEVENLFGIEGIDKSGIAISDKIAPEVVKIEAASMDKKINIEFTEELDSKYVSMYVLDLIITDEDDEELVAGIDFTTALSPTESNILEITIKKGGYGKYLVRSVSNPGHIVDLKGNMAAKFDTEEVTLTDRVAPSTPLSLISGTIIMEIGKGSPVELIFSRGLTLESRDDVVEAIGKGTERGDLVFEWVDDGAKLIVTNINETELTNFKETLVDGENHVKVTVKDLEDNSAEIIIINIPEVIIFGIVMSELEKGATESLRICFMHGTQDSGIGTEELNKVIATIIKAAGEGARDFTAERDFIMIPVEGVQPEEYSEVKMKADNLTQTTTFASAEGPIYTPLDTEDIGTANRIFILIIDTNFQPGPI